MHASTDDSIAPAAQNVSPGAAPGTVAQRTPRPTPARLPRALAFGALTGLASLIPLDRLTPAARRALIGVCGVAGAVAGPIALRAVSRRVEAEARTQEAALRRSEAGGDFPSVESNEATASRASRIASAAAAGLASGALAAGAAWFTLRTDRAAIEWLRRRGVERPRAWFGAAGLVLGTLSEFLDSAPTPGPTAGSTRGSTQGPTPGPTTS